MEKEFLSDLRKKARKYGIKVVMEKGDSVLYEGDNTMCGGYFDEDAKVLKIAKGKNKVQFYSILAHESSHLDQYIDSLNNVSHLWDKLSPGYTLFMRWLSGEIELSETLLNETVQDVISLEKDCEIRAIEKIKKYKLPVDIEDYKRKANTYLFAYLFFTEKRKWITNISKQKQIWSKAPKTFKTKYEAIPIRLYREFNKLYTQL